MCLRIALLSVQRWILFDCRGPGRVGTDRIYIKKRHVLFSSGKGSASFEITVFEAAAEVAEVVDGVSSSTSCTPNRCVSDVVG